MPARHPTGGKIERFYEKPDNNGTVDGQTLYANGGVYVIEPGALASIHMGEIASIERQVFPALAKQGQLGGYLQAEGKAQVYFADIGTPESLAAFEKDIYAGSVPGLSISR